MNVKRLRKFGMLHRQVADFEPASFALVYLLLLNEVLGTVLSHLRDGRYQRSLALIAGLSGLLSGVEVSSEHYRGSYGQRVMYSPTVLSALLAASGVASSAQPRYARRPLRLASWLLVLDGIAGFGFHVRGIHRKPGGWKNTIFNIVMGPPIFAPLLLTIGGFLGIVTEKLLPEESHSVLSQTGRIRLRRALALATMVSALLNGFEALYSHYKSAFSSKPQWIPIVLSPPLAVAGLMAIKSDRIAKTALPVLSVAAMAAGSLGCFFHIRGALSRPRGFDFYNLIYGPPPLAPLLFAATGLLGILASQMASAEGQK